MISFFTIPQNDQSIFFLSQIFGNVGNVYPVANATIWFAGMFKILNTTALILGAILVVHVTVVGLLKTASEGEFLGKQWSSLWVPLRTVIGIASLFPTGNGYSILQVIIMWIIVQGVGAADTLWTGILDLEQFTGSPYAAINIPTIKVSNNLQILFEGLVCQAEARLTDNVKVQNTDAPYYYYCAANQSTDTFCGLDNNTILNVISGPGVQASSLGNTVTYNMGPGGACGTLTYANPNQSGGACSLTDPQSQLICQGQKAQQAALAANVLYLGTVASLVASTDNDYLHFNIDSAGAGTLTPGSAITAGTTTPAPAATTQTNQIPSWIQKFCTANGASDADECCITGAKCKSSLFPSISDPNDLIGNTSSQAMNNVYLPYSIQPTLGDQQNFISSQTSTYINTVTGAITTWILAQGASSLTGWLKDAQSTGWIGGGVYYYKLAQINNNNLQAAMPSFSVSAPNPLPSSPGSLLYGHRSNYSAVAGLISTLVIQNQASGSFASQMPPQMTQVASAFTDSGSGITSSFMNTLTGAGPGGITANPLSSIVAFGDSLLIAAQVMFAVFISIAVLIMAFIGIRVFALGNGEIDSVPEAFMAGYLIFLPILMAFLSALFVFGGMLTIYTPLIPYIVFTFGVIGWLTATIEAMVAAPFVALGILSPGGQHEILGRADPAVMIMLNIFLRPSLMIFGMIAAMLMAGVVVSMINAGFSSVMASIHGSPGLVELILFIAAYVALIVAALNKCFALIYMLPNRVLTWIGGQAMSYGEEEGLSAVKGGVEGAAGKIASGAAVALSKPEGVAAHGRAHDAKQREKARATPTGSAGGGGDNKTDAKKEKE